MKIQINGTDVCIYGAKRLLKMDFANLKRYIERLGEAGGVKNQGLRHQNIEKLKWNVVLYKIDRNRYSTELRITVIIDFKSTKG